LATEGTENADPRKRFRSFAWVLLCPLWPLIFLQQFIPIRTVPLVPFEVRSGNGHETILIVVGLIVIIATLSAAAKKKQ
jgi:hypothetical protein